MKKLAIFDLDGTLCSTLEDICNAANYALRTNGFPEHKLLMYSFFIGNGAGKLMLRILPEGHQNESNVQQLRKDFVEYYDKHCMEHTFAYDGVVQLLEELSAMGVKLAVASNKYQEAVEKMILAMFPNIKFDVILGNKVGYPLKPDPSILFNVIEQIDIPKKDTIYIGDSGVDMEAANRAAIDSIGVTWGYRQRNELILNRATYIVDSVSQIKDIILATDSERVALMY
ncbi:MAG: HAD family hydrolase [Bacteroidales bacterium]